MDQKPRILIVEENADLSQILFDYLAANGFESKAVEDASEEGLVELCRDFQPHAVFLDVYIAAEPRGLSLARSLRENGHTRGVHVFFWSSIGYPALSSAATKELAEGLSSNDFIDKTEDLALLVEKLRSALVCLRPL